MATSKVLNIVVPMAGYGSRFSQAGYKDPKPLIDVLGKPMIERVIDNLRPELKHRFIFICQEEHFKNYRLPDVFSKAAGPDYGHVCLNGVTEGAACTVMTAAHLIGDDDDMLIANSDQLVDIDINEFLGFCRGSEADGVIMTFPADHVKWSYAKLNAEGFVTEVAEKKVISPHATVGIYYYSTGRSFKEATRQMIQKNIRVNNEFYVCPTYNEIIGSGGKIRIWEIDGAKMHGIGTPEDLNLYLARVR